MESVSMALLALGQISLEAPRDAMFNIRHSLCNEDAVDASKRRYL